MKTSSSKYIFLSKKGLKELKKTIAQLEHDQKKSIQELRELDKTASHEERLVRTEKIAALSNIEAELTDKKRMLKKARLLPSKRARLKVAVGSVVDLIDQQGRLFRYTIVNSIETNPSDGRISANSPLGQNLIGKTVHDIVELGQGFKIGQLQLVNIS